MKDYKPVVLIIRDGWGENHNSAHDAFNAVKLAQTPVAEEIRKTCPRTEISACGLDVGLPEGIFGNSEVGHQNIGAGRVVPQEIVRINKAFADGEVLLKPVIGVGLTRLRVNGGKLHLLGLISDAGVHSTLEHLHKLLEVARDKLVPDLDVCIHALTDGRDSPPRSGLDYVRQIEKKCQEIGIGRIASVCGRYWGMDRDKRWDRVETAYNCLVGKEGQSARTAEEAVQHYYDNPSGDSMRGDEFITPTWIADDNGEPTGKISDGDTVIFFNFRGDRPREITRAFIDDEFFEFSRQKKLDLFYVTMTDYEKGLCKNLLFPKRPKMKNILGEYISQLGIPQFRCAETEKYPHVTFFFNDYREEPFPGEERALIPSPRDVPTYDLKPEMSARGICQATKEAILSRKYGLIVVNFANPDMVGHAGSLPAAISACETVDSCLGELLQALKQAGGAALITADHGNSDQMWDSENEVPHTAHTLNPVEVVLAGSDCENLTIKNGGRLADIAPTLLRLMDLEKPPEMTGECLIV